MESYCRGCLREYDDPTELLQYSESNRRLFVYCTGLQVKRNDTFTFQLCKECFLNLKFSCKFKKLCRSSDKKFKTYLGLKNEGENIDFSTYLKNIDETFTLRLPTAIKNSTPPYQKNYDDDDNESTCTSIQNFMTDIHDTLQGEDMLQTEAKIIREVIEEEADISDDSLDSHWLQDDQVSMDNDFGMDFNFTGFSTPHTTIIDRCNTPEKITNNDEDDTCHYIHKDVILKSDKTIIAQSQKNKSSVNVSNRDVNNDIEYDVVGITETSKQKKTSNRNDMPLLDDCDITFDGIIERNESISEIEGYQLESVEKSEPVIDNKVAATKHVISSPFTNELEFYMKKVELQKVCNNNTTENYRKQLESNENTIDSIINETVVDGIRTTSELHNDVDQYINNDKLNVVTNIESQAEIELEKYVSKVELKKKKRDTSEKLTKNVGVCSIDKNLEIALKNNDSEFPLDDLLNSPQVSLPSGASTPTINNILFGSLTPKKAECAMPNSPVKTSISKQPVKDIKILAEKFKIRPKPLIQLIDFQRMKKSPEKVRKNIFKGSIRSQKDQVKSKGKIQAKKNKGYKDLAKIDKGNVNDALDEIKTVEESDVSEPSSDDELKHSINDDKVNSEDEMYVKVLQNTEPDDLDISLSNLLDFGDNNSVDLNISISSDFLKEDNSEQYSELFHANDFINNFDDDNTNDNEDVKDIKDPETLFKMPLPPPDNKYDLDKGLCKICDKSFKNARALKLHFVKVHKQLLPKSERKCNVLVCPTCGRMCKGDMSNFKKHMKSHDRNVESICKICTLKFETKGRLALHMRSHTNKQGDSNQTNEEENKTSKKRVENRKLVCDTCGKEFKAMGNYNVHMRRHTNNFKKTCEICQKGFFRLFDYQQHMAKHNGEYPFECQYCPKKYRNRYLLVNHMYAHLGVKELACEYCDQYFGSKQALLLHRKNAVCRRASDVVSAKNTTKKKRKRKSIKIESLAMDIDDEDLDQEPQNAACKDEIVHESSEEE